MLRGARALRVGSVSRQLALLALAVAPGIAVPGTESDHAEAAPAIRVERSFEDFFVPAQDSAEERGCCVLLTSPQPRCAYTNRGYCEARAREADIGFEFHEVDSCSNVPQCR